LRSSYCSLSQSAQSRAEQLPIRTYTTAEGLARDQVYKIVTDPRGFLWACTTDGLSRFDGYEFVNYSVAQGLPHRIVYDLVISGKGDYWVATSAADFDKGVQMDIGVASLLVVSDTLFRSNKTGVNLSVGGVEHMGASITRSRFEKNDVGLLTFTGNSVTVSNSTTAANFIAFETQAGGNLDVVNSTITKNHTGVKSTGDTSRSLTARSPEILREYRRAVGQSDRWATTRSSTTTSTSPERKTSSHSCRGNDE
jgi:hypothetical protein